MMENKQRPRVRFINSDDGTEIPATRIKVVLPDNSSFFIESESGREGSAVFVIPAGSPSDLAFKVFTIEPGAGNLFSVRVVEFARRQK